ncbi:MAG: hydroxyacid dehydrogenase [Conexivisphaerales archaeon]
MNSHKILVSDEIVEEAIELLRRNSFDVTYKPDATHEELASLVQDAEGLIVRSRSKVTKDVIARGSKLRIIARAGVGLDNIDLQEAQARGIKVVNAPDSLTNAVAEHSIALMLSVARSIPLAHHRMLRGEWPKSSLMGEELTGKVLGIVGFGRIGRRLAELAQPFRMKILTYDIIVPKEEVLKQFGAELVSLNALLERSDFISLHVPSTPETVKMISYEQFRRMKNSCILVNTSRGEVIDEAALIQALKEKRIRGAALDVFQTEPPKNEELFRLDNLVLTPHIAGQTAEAQLAAGMSVANQLIEFFR